MTPDTINQPGAPTFETIQGTDMIPEGLSSPKIDIQRFLEVERILSLHSPSGLRAELFNLWRK